MRQYRVYQVSHCGRFIGPSRILAAADDEEALEVASKRQPKSVMGLELWTGNRLVALVPLNPDASEAVPEKLEVIAPAPLTFAGPQAGVLQMDAAPATEG